MRPKDIDGMANSLDLDQTANQEQSDLSLHCLLRPTCPNTWNFTANAELFFTVRFRLENGTDIFSGRIGVYYRREWGTVCDDYFGAKEAEVVCRSLGFR